MPAYPTAAALAIESAVVLAEWPGRARVRVSGADRARFLHNFTTNEVKARPPGSGCEAFVTSPQGRSIGLVSLLVLEDAILLRTEAEGLAPVVAHLGKYGVLDDISLDDETAETFELHLAGPRAAGVLGAAGVAARPGGELDHLTAEVAGAAVRVVREDPIGAEGYTLIGRSEDGPAVRDALRRAGEASGLVELTPDAWEALRIEAGTPASGRDVTEKNLPQELARDARAISFTKGCYLGQETVARLDALGHVNRLIRGLRIEAEAPPPAGSRLFDGEKEVGWIGSSAVSGRTGRPVALAYVRTSHAEPGSRVVVRPDGMPECPAAVSTLPMAPRSGAI